jgi:hypothetical protein
MTYLERRLASANYDRMAEEIESVAQEPAVAELLSKK